MFATFMCLIQCLKGSDDYLIHVVYAPSAIQWTLKASALIKQKETLHRKG